MLTATLAWWLMMREKGEPVVRNRQQVSNVYTLPDKQKSALPEGTDNAN